MSEAVRTAAQATKDAVVFKALANSVRLQIVWFVAASPDGQVSAGDIVDRFDLSQPTISHHLRVLREAGVLTTYKSSTFVYYRFAPSLRETVTSVLPSGVAAEPPAEFTPPKKAAAGATAAKAAGGRTAPASGRAAGRSTGERSNERSAAPETPPAKTTADSVQTKVQEKVQAKPESKLGKDDKPKKDKKPKKKSKKDRKK